MLDQKFIACHDCDLLQLVPATNRWTEILCIRCDASLYQYKKNSLNRSISLLITAFVLFTVANVFPFIILHSQGQILESTLVSGSVALYKTGYPILSALVLLTTVIFPTINIIGMLYILLPIRMGFCPYRMRILYRFLRLAAPWGMLEVLLLGVLVASIKLHDLAIVIPGIALYSFILAIVVLTALETVLDPHLIWQHKIKYEK